MAIENYEIPLAQAEKIPAFYFPGGELDVAGRGLEFLSRDEGRPNPTVMYAVKGFKDARCKLTLHPAMPIVKFVDIAGQDADMARIHNIVEGALEIELKKAV